MTARLLSTAAVAVALLTSIAISDSAPTPHVHVEVTDIAGLPSDRRFVDELGRERLFRGVNVVYKDPPWLPTATVFNTNFSFVPADAKLLASLGFNLIRLGVMWPGVMPSNAQEIDRTYIAEIKKLIAIASAEGIYTMIDPHQDEMNPRFCGEGVPNWWVRQHTSTGDFPIPVRKEPFPRNNSRLCPGLRPEPCPGIDFPGRALCDKNISFSYIWTHAAAKAHQTLWENSGDFAEFWKTTARELHGLAGVLGGELWNEPFPGDVFAQPQFRNNKYADLVNLYPFYTNVTRSIRDVVPDQKAFAIAYEPTWPTGDYDINPSGLLPSTSGFQKLPEENAIYAFHWYVPPADSNLSRYLDERVADARRLKAVPYVSEWNFGASAASKDIQEFASNVAQFESRRLAYTGWQYKNYQGALPGGTCTGCGSSFFESDGTAKAGTFAGMSTPFAQAVAGRVVSISVPPLDAPVHSRQYQVIYKLSGTMAPTEIVVPSEWMEIDALEVSAEPPGRVTIKSVAGAQLTKDIGYKPSARVLVQHEAGRSKEAFGTVVTVTIQAKEIKAFV